MMKNQMIQALKTGKTFLLSGHVNPDGDALGALAGMAFLLKYLGKEAIILLEQVPKKYAYLVEGLTTCKDYEGEYDSFVALDCGSKERLGSYEKYFEKATHSYNIDHHYSNDLFGLNNYVDKEASSTSELVFELIEEVKMPLEKEVAIALYSGIVYDTGGFMHSCTRPSTHEMAAKLLTISFDAPKIYQYIIHLRTKKTCLLQGILIKRAKWIGKDKAFSYITTKDLEENDCELSDIDGIVNYLKNIEDIHLAAILYPSSSGGYKLSLRSDPPYDVAKFAGFFGGGGHQRASGATLEGNLEKLIPQLITTLEEF